MQRGPFATGCQGLQGRLGAGRSHRRRWAGWAFMETTNTTAGSAGRVRITLVRSTIGFDKRQARVVRGLGLRRLNHTVELQDTPSIRGMIHKVRHLVRVTEGFRP